MFNNEHEEFCHESRWHLNGLHVFRCIASHCSSVCKFDDRGQDFRIQLKQHPVYL